MTPFERLHPALRHHVVNSLGWRELRPFQEAAIGPALDGAHLVILAPTAGGKTEAAFFPVLSRMLSEDWTGLSTLYLCPIKALLNNLETRLARYCSLVGRRAALWHGDVSASARRAILRDPPGCLLTTPESLEVMLVSPNVDARRLFAGLRSVVVDEIHAFAGDDRGWHLLSVLERAGRIAGRELQRVGLSATVGNPETLLEWLAGPCEGPKRVLYPPAESPPASATPGARAAAPAPSPGPDVRIDHVGSLANAATVISRLHRGEKRLVFVDSRSRAEELGSELRARDVTTFVTHSSLGREERHQAEAAFASRDDCVIVATGVLELGVDVGDLDRVIQIDSPRTVAGFLQRMGRTGRRAGSIRNCLFLATTDDALLRAAALVSLWESGFVEPVEPPPAPYHLLAQQLMALALQERGIGRRDWRGWVGRVPAFAAMPSEGAETVLAHMLETEILWEDAGLLGIGRRGETLYGRKHFLELMSVFLAPPLFFVLHGRREVGFVDELTFLTKSAGPRVIALGGRSWRVTHLDWSRRTAYVEPSEDRGRSRWQGGGEVLGAALARSVRDVLASDARSDRWSRRAAERLEAIRGEFSWLAADGTAVVVDGDGETTWWTFAGTRANACLAPALGELLSCPAAHDGVSLRFGAAAFDRVRQAVAGLRSRDPSELAPEVAEEAIGGLKFADCLPDGVAEHVLQRRSLDPGAVAAVLGGSVRFARG